MKRIQCRIPKVNNRYIIHGIGAFIAGLIQGLALGTFGVFQDSQIYYELYKIVGKLGIYDSVLVFMAETSKFEPVIVTLFAVESILSGGLLTEYWFLVINMILLNLLVFSVMLTLISNKYKNAWYMIIISFSVMSGYLVFSKVLYVWRSAVAFIFFILFIKGTSWKRLIWAVIACLTHITFVMFILLYMIIEIVSRSRKQYVIIVLGIGMLVAVSLVQLYPDIFGLFASGGNTTAIFLVGGEHTIKAWLAILFSLIVLLLVYSDYMINKSLRPLYIFCLMTVIASLVSYNSYQFMNRIILPAVLVVGFLPFLIESDTLRFKLARLCIFLSILPTARLLYMLFSGSFSPG